jgi:hypothetical protein
MATVRSAIIVLLAAMTLIGPLAGFRPPDRVIDTARDGDYRYALIERGAERLLTVDMATAAGQLRLYENNFLELHPWKLDTADVDGDGVRELLIAVQTSTTFDPRNQNRMFIFNYDGTKLVKKWTGSQIGGVWSTFVAGDLLPIPGEELMFIERLPEGGERIVLYYWLSFGFQQLAESDRFDKIVSIQIAGSNRLMVKVAEGGRTRLAEMKVKDGRMVEGE